MGVNSSPSSIDSVDRTPEPPRAGRGRVDVTPMRAEALEGFVEQAVSPERPVHLERRGAQTYLVFSTETSTN